MTIKFNSKCSLNLMPVVFLMIISSGIYAQFSQNADHIQQTAQIVNQKIPFIEPTGANSFSISEATWVKYCLKTNELIEKVDLDGILNYIILSNDGKLGDKKKFLDFVNKRLRKDKEMLVYKVGKGELTNSAGITKYLHSLQPVYAIDYIDFKKINDANEERQLRAPGTDPPPVPFNCGSPCTNPGFESGNGFWDYWTGTSCSNADPCGLVTGFNAAEHSILTAGAYDAIVGGTILPVVPPGGGNNALRLGNTNIGGQAARASMSFTVSASNANFTYRYAVVLEDPTSPPHTDPERPYFRVKIRDAGGNVVTCGDYEVICKPPLIDFTQVGSSNYYYRNWTTVFVPLSSYIGQCITVEFTSSDCAQTGHLGYAYIDADCDPLAVLSSSPAVCGGNNVTLTAPSGGVSYSWTNTSGGTTGIVGPTNQQTCVVDQGGTYQVVVTSVSGPTCTTTLNITVGSSPANPVPAFSNTSVCVGSATSFTDASTPTGSVTAWAWDFNADGTTDDINQNPSYTFPAAGTYPVSLTITMGPCMATVTQNVTVNPGITPTITPAGPFCENAAASNLIGNPAGGTWSGTGITDIVAGTFTPSASVVGSNTVTYSIGGACPATVNSIVVVNSLPISEAGSMVNICSGAAASIGTANTIGYTYSWLPAAGLSDATISNPSVTTVNSGSTPIVTTYTVTTTANNCSTTDTVTVIVNPQPVLTITNPAAVCSPNTVDITPSAVTSGSTGGGALSYWTDAAGTIALTAPTAVSASGTYYIKVIATGGCTDIDPVTVTINSLPVSDAGTDVTICSGIAASIGTSSVAGNDYSWSPVTGLSASNISNPSITATNPGTSPIVTIYTVTTTITSTGCTSTDDVTVTVNPQPVLTITDPAAVCSPNTVDITLSSITSGSTGGGVFSYWTDAAGTITLTSPTVITASGTYYIKVTATGGCTDIDPVNVVINPLPNSEAGADVNICSGMPGSIGSPAIAGNTYLWSPAAGLTATNISDPGITTTNSGTTPIVTTYTITTTIISTGCSSVDSAVVTVNPLPVLTTTDPASVCFPGSVDITLPAITAGTILTGTLSYWLNSGATASLLNPSTVDSSGTYYIKIITSAGCSDLDSVTVTINPLPVSVPGAPLEICTGSSGPIGGASLAGYTYQWLPATGLSSDIVSNPVVTLTNITLAPVNTTYTVTTTNNATGCQSSDSVVVSVFPVATANAGSSQSVCSGTSLILGGAVGGSASGGTWGGGAGTYSPDNSTLNAVYTPSAAEFAAGTVTLTLTTNDPTGPCTFASSSVIFYFYPNPVVDFSVNDREGCPVHCVNFTDLSTISGGESIVSWDWSFGDDSVNSSMQNPSHCYPLTALYDISLTVTSNNGCTSDSTQVQMVEVFATPVAEFTADPNPSSVLNPLVTLNNGSSPDVIYWNYYFGDGDSTSPSTPSPEHMYPSSGPGVYTATLIVHNSDNCWDTVQHDITIGPEFTFFIPNAFTPNDDGINDYFYGQGIGIEEYDIYIFDRWGDMIYHGDDIYTSMWNGKANAGSEIAQQDVYVWKVQLTDVFGKKHSYIGTVTLVK